MRQGLRQLRSASGFTLIELMVTIAVLAVLVSLAFPVFNQIEQRRIVGAAESTVNMIQMARTEAIKQGRNISFVSEGSGTNWCVAVSDDSGCSCAPDADNPCGITLDGDGDRTAYGTDSSAFRDVAMNSGGGQVFEFSHVRGTLVDADGREGVVFQTARNAFEVNVSLNRIGRPSICGQNRPFGGYPQCSD